MRRRTGNYRQTWDDDITLISSIWQKDEVGNSVESLQRVTVSANKRSATRLERSIGGKQGLILSYVFVVHPYEYEGQERLEHNELQYNIIDTYEIDSEHLELKCVLSKGVNNG